MQRIFNLSYHLSKISPIKLTTSSTTTVHLLTSPLRHPPAFNILVREHHQNPPRPKLQAHPIHAIIHLVPRHRTSPLFPEDPAAASGIRKPSTFILPAITNPSLISDRNPHRALRDSLPIVQHLDKVFPGPSIFQQAEKASIWRPRSMTPCPL